MPPKLPPASSGLDSGAALYTIADGNAKVPVVGGDVVQAVIRGEDHYLFADDAIAEETNGSILLQRAAESQDQLLVSQSFQLKHFLATSALTSLAQSLPALSSPAPLRPSDSSPCALRMDPSSPPARADISLATTIGHIICY